MGRLSIQPYHWGSVNSRSYGPERFVMKRIWIDWVYTLSCIPSFFCLLWRAAKNNRSHYHWNNLPWWKGWCKSILAIRWNGVKGLWWAARHPIECTIGYLAQYDCDSIFVAYEEDDGSFSSLFVYTPFFNHCGDLFPNYYTLVWTPYGCLPFPWFTDWIGYSWSADLKSALNAW